MHKKYKCGLYIGRFQPIHWGHYSIIESMIMECETVIVAVGSAQECGTERNPFSYGLRASMISKVFSWANQTLVVIPVVDREHPSNDPSWGDYLLETVKTFTGLTPDVIYEGEETERSNWYDNYDIPVVRISRSLLKTSGSEVRQLLLEDKRREFEYKVPLALRYNKMYDKLRKELLQCYNLQET